MNVTVCRDEAQRLAALHGLEILDTEPEAAFDAIVSLAARICDTPIALITLVDNARQWFKAKVGLDLISTTRDMAFCVHAIQGEGICTVADALADDRFRANPLVLGEPRIRFYAGAPLVTSDGFALGTLCVIDRKPREGLSEHQRISLELLAKEAMTQLELRRTVKQLADTKMALEDANASLEAFSSALAHDMRAPVRTVAGFADVLKAQLQGNLLALQYVQRIEAACSRMQDLNDALLRRAHSSHQELVLQTVDLSRLATEISEDLKRSEPARRARFIIQEGVTATADESMIRIVLVNLMGNAWKFTRARPEALIEFGSIPTSCGPEFFVRDNGQGFDPSVPLLPSRPFAKHHSGEGFGVGLALVERIIRRHRGTLRASADIDAGAIFTFTLGR
jgi:signal transduction histidine kinase